MKLYDDKTKGGGGLIPGKKARTSERSQERPPNVLEGHQGDEAHHGKVRG